MFEFKKKLKNTIESPKKAKSGNWYVVSRIFFCILLCFLFGKSYLSIDKIADDEDIGNTGSSLEALLGTNGVSSAGFNHGNIYSIDGVKITEDVEYYGNEYQCAADGFSSVLGAENVGGMINTCFDTLHSTANKVNVDMKTGNNIVTTFHYKGQTRAVQLLKNNYSFNDCNSASVSVVLKDGTILVAAGINSYKPNEINFTNLPKDFCIDQTVSNYKLGSVAKPVTSRTLLENDKYVRKINEEDSLRNEKYKDLSVFTSGTVTIRNHDCDIEKNYEETDPVTGVRTRKISLPEALMYSSNTYFWRHAMTLGLDRTYKLENKLFNIGVPIQTEINTIKAVEVDDNRLDYFFWGQDFNCSTTRICEIYNHIISGEAYVPFYVTAVTLPDDQLIYKAVPKKVKSLDLDIEDNDLLRNSLSQCFEFYCKNIDSIYNNEKYKKLIENKRLLAKSGTADVDLDYGITNNTRVLTVLDDKDDVVCTASILVERAKHDAAVNDLIMFSILFEVLEATGII